MIWTVGQLWSEFDACEIQVCTDVIQLHEKKLYQHKGGYRTMRGPQAAVVWLHPAKIVQAAVR